MVKPLLGNEVTVEEVVRLHGLDMELVYFAPMLS
jgi:hypothetical protein